MSVPILPFCEMTTFLVLFADSSLRLPLLLDFYLLFECLEFAICDYCVFLRWLLERERDRFKELLLLLVGVLRVLILYKGL